ncbi:hypothetical protein OVA24_19945 [Luteolibacter sp. SL250]|uniref:hypothetical protein n=1 Tax=Luteolibacter sp. SL250 TaxID=2995170 RepID=UPI0022700A31|nr:hypothetical protein [Luteolibacter sp. SL250]WAC19501.1 hypothetical protein OVA24_19945 [Luteolibacter sp. SL250]
MKTLLACLATILTLPAHAAILVAYDFNGGNNTATASDPDVLTGPIIPHGSINHINRPVIYPNSGTNGWAAAPTSEIVGTGGVPGTEATSFSGNDHFSFTVTPASGFALSLTQLKFSTAFHSSGTFNLTGWYFVRSSRDGFAANIGSVFSETHVNSTDPAFTEHVLDLSAAIYQDIMSDVTFRIYLYDNSNSETRWMAIDDVSLEGTASPIPETSSLALMLPGLALLTRQRRREERR